MIQEIDDSRKWRVSMSGFSIKTGWGDAKKIIAEYPGKAQPLDAKKYEEWLENAEHICQLHNLTLLPNSEKD
jgi:hypothetical protein